MCAGGNITLTHTVAGGVWSSAGTMASVSGGVVQALSGGVDTILLKIVGANGEVWNFRVVKK